MGFLDTHSVNVCTQKPVTRHIHSDSYLVGMHLADSVEVRSKDAGRKKNIYITQWLIWSRSSASCSLSNNLNRISDT